MTKNGADVECCDEDEIVHFLINFVPNAIFSPIGILTCSGTGGINGKIAIKPAHLVFSLNCKKCVISLNFHLSIYLRECE
ncbi:hypothetical protein [Caldicellulosiruptor sp. F32]|uniref:hypothetical protein n=1 Tax=Caldicellulosiruptor sp. F32 TaxID=1214564 RepID=UPI003FA4AAC7